MTYSEFKRTHNAGGTPYKFPKDLFVKFVQVRNSIFARRARGSWIETRRRKTMDTFQSLSRLFRRCDTRHALLNLRAYQIPSAQGSVIYTHTPVFIITAEGEYRYGLSKGRGDTAQSFGLSKGTGDTAQSIQVRSMPNVP